jgi:hypothetical protein
MFVLANWVVVGRLGSYPLLVSPGLANSRLTETRPRPGPGLITSARRSFGLDAIRHAVRESAASFLAGMLGTVTQGLGGDDLLTAARARHSAPC